jgi:PTS system fructose-specific IIC component
LRAELIFPDVATRRRDDVLSAVAARLASCCPEVDRNRLAAALFKREGLMTTALTDGVAIPHARLGGLTCTLAAFGRSPTGIDWDAQDGGLTHLFFVLVVPDEAQSSHLRLLAAASRLLHDAGCRSRLMQAPDDALLQTLRAEENRAIGSTRGIRTASSTLTVV